MSLATIDTLHPAPRPEPTSETPERHPAPRIVGTASARPEPRPAVRGSVPGSPAARAVATPAARIRAVPEGTEPRGFALYVGLDEVKAASAGVDLPVLVARLREVLAEIAPEAETFATVALAPTGSGGRDVDVVRLALQDPAALARQRRERAEAAEEARKPAEPRAGVVIDISRKRVLLEGEVAPLTYTEFELLQFLVLREGRTIDRAEIIATLWADATGDEVPNARTIDVHVRRLRSKLGGYEDIVRTVRGAGYRFDRHADVAIRWASTPSPDVF
ncbi:MAG: winged helix-turn-helix transcriptional regulator [Actinomycetales bacterium]|nr:winged helix-turn-helix transcriptional regulator [Actinomycetales bacterium]